MLRETAMAEQIDDSQVRLTPELRERTLVILERTRQEISDAAGGDSMVEFSIRRYIYNLLQRDERGTATERIHLKMKLFDQQEGRCPLCHEPLPSFSAAQLHRKRASVGYSEGNVWLLHPGCRRKQQSD
jgi:hypothetical protein